MSKQEYLDQLELVAHNARQVIEARQFNDAVMQHALERLHGSLSKLEKMKGQ